jgi:segregation and condensation protein A
MSTDNPSSSAADKQTFRVASFEGPLDLLLFLIRKAEINIYDIPIATITEQYLEYLSYATRVDLENLTEFYAMAATLLLIKSKMLLPLEVNLEEEYEDPRRDLVEKLIEYQKFRRLSELMEAKEEEAEWSLERRKTQKILPFEDDGIWEKISVWDLLRSFSSMITTLTPERVIDLYEEVTVNEKITLIHEYVETRGQFYFTDLLIKKSSIMEVVCSFLAVLELVKGSLISIFQNRLFGDILIKPRSGRAGDGG